MLIKDSVSYWVVYVLCSLLDVFYIGHIVYIYFSYIIDLN